MPKGDPNKGYLLPYVINPARIGVCVPVPDDPNHRRAFMGALYELTWARNWQHDDTDAGLQTSLVWSEIYREVREKLGVELCQPGPVTCREYGPLANFIEYHPNDPRYTPGLVPEGYIFPPWYMATDISNEVYGTKTGDVVTTIDRLPPGSLPTIIPASGLPRCRINLNVSDGARVTVYLRNMRAGSLMQSTIDDDISTLLFTDCNQDIVSLPPESNDAILWEHVFEVGGQHHIDFIVVSWVNDEFPFLLHGGGIEKVIICGEVEDLPVTTIDNELILRAIADMKREFRVARYDGSPTSININAPTYRYDGAEGQSDQERVDRAAALCVAVRHYVYATMHEAHSLLLAGAGAAGSAGLVAFLLGGPIGWLVGVIVMVVAAYSYQEVFDAATDTEALDEVVCDLYNALTGQLVSQSSFSAAIASLAVGTGSREVIVTILNNYRNVPENYHFFLDALGYGYLAAQGGAVNDCCQPDYSCDAVVDFRLGAAGGYLVTGSIELGEGLSPSHNDGTSYVSQWRVEWETPCIINPTNGVRIWLHNAGPSNAAAWRPVVKLASTGEWVIGSAGPIAPGSDGWFLYAGPGGSPSIIGFGVIVGKPNSWTQAVHIRALQWDSDPLTGTDPPF